MLCEKWMSFDPMLTENSRKFPLEARMMAWVLVLVAPSCATLTLSNHVEPVGERLPGGHRRVGVEPDRAARRGLRVEQQLPEIEPGSCAAVLRAGVDLVV